MTLTDTRRSLLVLTTIMLFQILRPARAFSTRQQGSWIQNGRRKFHPTKCSLKAATTSTDNEYLLQAVQHATLGKGHTFPNPAVGCVLVRQDTGEVVGKGFHPRAGYPHAEGALKHGTFIRVSLDDPASLLSLTCILLL